MVNKQKPDKKSLSQSLRKNLIRRKQSPTNINNQSTDNKDSPAKNKNNQDFDKSSRCE